MVLFFLLPPTEGACFVVEEIMLQEAFDLHSTQILSLYALSNYLSAKPQLTVSDHTQSPFLISHLFLHYVQKVLFLKLLV